MKISQQTLEVLKNLSNVNDTFIMEQEGDVLRTKSPLLNQVAFAKVPEVFPKFAIYSLKDFLPIASMFPEADFDFGATSVTISSGKSSFTYAFCAEQLVDPRPPKSSAMPEPDVTLSVDKSTFKTLSQAANVLGVEDIFFKSKNGKILAGTEADKNEGNSNKFFIELGDCPPGIEFNFVFNSSIFKFIPGDYSIKFSSKKIAEFSCDMSQLHHITYWLAMKSCEFSKE